MKREIHHFDNGFHSDPWRDIGGSGSPGAGVLPARPCDTRDSVAQA